MVTGISVAEGFEEADLAVEIPDAIEGKMVTKIGAGAFMSCQSLTKVMFGEGSTPGFADADSYARNGVFKDCTALTSMKLPAGTTKLGSCMEGLLNATIVIPESVTVSLSDSEGKIFTALMDLRLFSKQAGKL